MLVSIDPNIKHLGIENPQQYVNRLVEHFGLAAYHLLVVGYTLEKNISEFDLSRPTEFQEHMALLNTQAACENVLPNLAQLGMRADFVLIDGNHDAQYLARELRAIQTLLAKPALVILDDVNERWNEIQNLYETIVGQHEMIEVARNQRMGILLNRTGTR